MTDSTQPGACPRCRTTSTRTHARSATAGAWALYGCDACFYTWRSTEPAQNTDPDHYPAIFSLKLEQIPKMPVVPVIPPLAKKA